MRRSFGYIRVSTEHQADQFGLEIQRNQISAYTNYRLMPNGFSWAGFYEDPAVSGTKPFRDREAGGRLLLDLQEGDAVVFARLDRGFRNVRDCLATVDLFDQRKVGCHFVDIQVDTSSYSGRFFLTLLAAFAEFERNRIVERNTLGLRALRQKRRVGARPPYGFKWTGPKGKMRLVPDDNARNVGRKLLELYEQGYTSKQLEWWCKQHNIRDRLGVEISRRTIQNIVKREANLRAKEVESDR